MVVTIEGEYVVPEWVDVEQFWNVAQQDAADRGIKLFDCERYFLKDHVGDIVIVHAGRYQQYIAARVQYEREHPVSWFEFCRTITIVGVAAIAETLDCKIVLGHRVDSYHDNEVVSLVPSGGLTGSHKKEDFVDAYSAIAEECREELIVEENEERFGLSLPKESFRFLGVTWSCALVCWNPTLVFSVQLPYPAAMLRPNCEHSKLIFIHREELIPVPAMVQQALSWLS